jgi:hypothetical protein
VAQFAWNSFLPSSMVCCDVGSASAWAAVPVFSAAYAPPVNTRPSANSATVASGCRRPVRRFERFIEFFLFTGMLCWRS